MKKYIHYSLMFVLALIFYSCGGASEFEEDAPRRTPIKNYENIGIIGFQKAVSDIPPSTIVGGFYTGWAKVLRQEYYASGFIEDRYQRTYEDVITSELKNAGYETISKNVVFDTTSVKQTRYLIGATIIDGRLNYYKSVSENNADALLNIRWELYDTQEKKIIYSHKELGTYRDAESDLYAYRESVRVSFRNFLAEKDLVRTLKDYIKTNPLKNN